MAYQAIGVGAAPNDHTGDNLRAAGIKINANFVECYNNHSALVGVVAGHTSTLASYGTAALKNTGTSGNVVPLLDGTNQWSGRQTFTGAYAGTSAVAINILAALPGIAFMDSDGGGSNRSFGFYNGYNASGRMSWMYSSTAAGNPDIEAIQIDAAASPTTIKFPQIGTTASAANAYLDNLSNNSILRSTSSLAYKEDVEKVAPEFYRKILDLNAIWYRSKAPSDRKEWSWYGLAAEEVAAIDPRLVHWTRPVIGYTEEEFTTEVPDTEDVEVERLVAREKDGRKVYAVEIVTVQQPRMVRVPIVGSNGAPITKTVQSVGDYGEAIEIQEPQFIEEAATKTLTHVRKQPIYGDPIPDGVMYDRIPVLMLEVFKDLLAALREAGIDLPAK